MRAYDGEPLPLPPEEVRIRRAEYNRVMAEAIWRVTAARRESERREAASTREACEHLIALISSKT